MAQAYDPLTADRTFAASYPTINSSDEALRTNHSGATAPASTVAYMIWYDTANGLIKERNSTNTDWVTKGQIGVTNGGMLPTSGGTMSGDIAMAGFKVTGAGAASAANDLVRKAEHDLKAPLASPAFTTDATLDVDPPGNNSLIRRIWAEGRYLKLAGGSMTALFNLFADATSALHAVTLQQLKTFVLFNTSTGHRHDGTDARKVQGSDLNSGAATNGQVLKANGSGGASFANGADPFVAFTSVVEIVDDNTGPTTYQTVNLGSGGLALVPATSTVAVVGFFPGGGSTIRVRALGESDNGTLNERTKADGGDFPGKIMHVKLDSSGRFEWRWVTGNGTIKMYLLGYFTR